MEPSLQCGGRRANVPYWHRTKSKSTVGAHPQNTKRALPLTKLQMTPIHLDISSQINKSFRFQRSIASTTIHRKNMKKKQCFTQLIPSQDSAKSQCDVATPCNRAYEQVACRLYNAYVQQCNYYTTTLFFLLNRSSYFCQASCPS